MKKIRVYSRMSLIFFIAFMLCAHVVFASQCSDSLDNDMDGSIDYPDDAGCSSADSGVAGVQFKLNGNNLGAEDTTAPYSISWNTSEAANGDVSNISVLDITHASALIGFDVSMDKAAYGFIEFGREAAYGYRTVDTLFDSALTPKHFERALTGLAPSTTYHYRVGVKEKDTGITYYSGDNIVTTKPGEAIEEPQLPQAYVDTSLPVQTGNTLYVESTCTNLQQQIDAAQLGDTVIIPSGTVCSGGFTFPAKTGSGWVVVRTSTPDAQLPAGIRVSPSQSPLLATIRLNNTMQDAYKSKPFAFAINISDNAHHYRFIGLEITTEKSASTSDIDPPPYYGLVNISKSASYIIFDRSYFHGQDYPDRLRKGIDFNGVHVAIINSYFDRMSYWLPFGPIYKDDSDPKTADWWYTKYQTYQPEGMTAIKVGAGPGPGLVENNHIEGVGLTYFQEEYTTVRSGGDYVLRGNHFFNPEKYRPGSAEWDGHNYKVRQFFELKRGVRYLLEGNVFENYWADINQGFAFVVSSRPARVTNTDISDLTVRNNIFKNGTNGITFLCFTYKTGDQKGTKTGRRFKISNNLFVGIDGWKYVSSKGQYPWGQRGNILRTFSGCEDLQFEHNTAYNNRGSGPRFLALGGDWGSSLKYDNNILWMNNDGGAYGSLYDGSSAQGMTPQPQGRGSALFNNYWLRNPDPAWSFDNNVVVAGVTNSKDMTGNVKNVSYARSLYPATNFWPEGATPVEREAKVEFTNAANMDFSLKPTSPYKNKATDGKDPGVDMAALVAATACAVSGQCGIPLPPDTTPPSVPTNLTATAVSSSQINLSWTASTDNVGVVGYKVYRAGTQIATVTSGTTYQNTGLSPSTTYTYTVSAYDAAGNNSAQSSSASATTQAILYGDVSGNGAITSYDASLAALYAVGLITLTPEQITKADVSGDGSVSAFDALLIAQYAVGLIDRFPVEG